jgi:hypothetical protein
LLKRTLEFPRNGKVAGVGNMGLELSSKRIEPFLSPRGDLGFETQGGHLCPGEYLREANQGVTAR